MQQQLLPAAVHKLWMCATFDTGPIQNFSFFNIWWTTCSYFSLSNFINTRTFKCAHKMNVVWHTNKRTFILTHTFFFRTGKKAKHKIIWHVKRKINLINIRRGAHCFVRVHVFEKFYVQTKKRECEGGVIVNTLGRDLKMCDKWYSHSHSLLPFFLCPKQTLVQ